MIRTFNITTKRFNRLLPDEFTVQFVFPSPMYPWLQEQLNEPNVFTQEATLGRQSWTPS